ITQFGRLVGEPKKDAGLKMKVPFIQIVHRLEKRLLPWDGEPENMQTREKKGIYIDVWARWRISDPKKFFQAVRTEQRGQGILDNLVNSAVRDVVARYSLIEVVRSTNEELFYESEELAKDAAAAREMVTTGRAKMEAEILTVASTELEVRYGMALEEVRIKRINYNEEVRSTVYDRMSSERRRIAKLFESQGVQETMRIEGRTRKELEQIRGEMLQKSAELRGAGDAAVITIAAEAFSQGPEFYEFLRRMEAYERTLGRRTRLILSTENEFFRHLRDPMGSPSAGE
ncbi:MAG: protease modulator HflC, partial [Candidatus Brocadiia bacterium]|nr:protease modulator HflC [Candidatus Brocadiia bacterium]